MNMIRERLHGMSFPATKQDLVNQAMRQGASEEQMEIIKKMPNGKFKTMDDAMAAADMMMKTNRM